MRPTLPFLLLLSFTAGYADSATFVHLFGLFSAHVTGNFVVLAASIGKGFRAHDMLKLASFPVFVAAAFVATAVHDRLTQKNTGEDLFDRTLTFAVAVLLLIAAVVAGALSGPANALSEDVSPADALAGLLCVAAMGIQNTIQRLALALGPPTTVMTGTVTQLTMMLARRVFPQKTSVDKAPQPAFTFRCLTLLTISFAAGCLVSVPLTLQLGLAVLALPGFLLLAFTLFARAGETVIPKAQPR